MFSRKSLILIFFATGIVSIIVMKIFGKSICFFYNVYGITCLTCGMTRSYIHLLHGNFHRAFELHPLFWLVPFFVLAIKRIKFFYFIVGIFIIVWIIRLYLYFPNKEPFIYNKNSLFYKGYELIIK